MHQQLWQPKIIILPRYIFVSVMDYRDWSSQLTLAVVCATKRLQMATSGKVMQPRFWQVPLCFPPDCQTEYDGTVPTLWRSTAFY